MAERSTKLREQPGGMEVAAVLHDLLALDVLFDAEEQWCVHRVRVLRELAAAGVYDPGRGWPESVHWNWAMKAATCQPARLESAGDVRLFGVETAGQWQALLFGLSEGHGTRLGTVGRPLVYVDFVEVTPWNWDVPLLGRVGRFRGAGVQLIELAVRWSLGLGFGGRVGLHALQQAETFYDDRCRMQNLGADDD